MKQINRILVLFFLGMMLVTILMSNINKQSGYIPPNGFVPDTSVAIKIAEAILFPIYGEDKIKKQRPYNVMLIDSGTVWSVRGSFPKLLNNRIRSGGTFGIKIQKLDGRIIEVFHEK